MRFPHRGTVTMKSAAAAHVAILALAVLPFAASAASPLPPSLSHRCGLVDCPAGTVVITAPAGEGPFFVCPTAALSDYTNLVLGFLSAGKMLGAGMPNVDPATGEPAYQGESARMLADFRRAAGVSTFDQAVARCRFGKPQRRVTVLNFVRGREAVWVSDGQAKATYWLPAGMLDIAKPRRR